MSEFLSDKRVLITGGVGFIGSNLAERLVLQGAKVTLLDSMLPEYGAVLGNIEAFRNKVDVNFSDLRDAHSLKHLVQEHDYIFCLAGQVSHIDSMTDPLTDLAINCASQLNLLEACRHNNPNARLIFTSTRQLYGKPQYLPVDEKHPKVPVDINGINKLAAESYYYLYAQVHGLKTISLRLTNTYGPRMDLRSGRKGFLNTFLARVLRGEKIQLFGDGEQKRDLNYVDDVVDALLSAAQGEDLKGQAYNLAHPTPYSLKEIVEHLQQCADFEVEYIPFPEEKKAIDIGDYYGDAGLFQQRCGWQPKVDLEAGLNKTIDFFRAHTDLY
ncbi:MAG: NAD-dependent epimerase/dehydratase family protein [Myxococcota bacterium]|jgi:nucleoside-diphosphate-sugar epimerase|nr:NAD-dependent epimerase/dehydratase family protein [Myxococcota bacterium]